MLGHTTHFEVLARTNRLWTIVDVVNTRKEAIFKAEKLWEQCKYQGIKVLKETFEPDKNMFTSLEVLVHGAPTKPQNNESEDALSPCLSIEDMSGVEGRGTLWGLLHNTFESLAITPSELLHNLDHYNALKTMGAKLDDAIHRAAVTYDKGEDSFQRRIKKLRQLTEDCVSLLKDHESKIPVLNPKDFRGLVFDLDEKANRTFLLSASLTKYLKTAPSIEDKFHRLMALSKGNQPAWVLAVFDTFIADTLRHKRVLARSFPSTITRIERLKMVALLAGGSLERLPGAQPYALLPAELRKLNTALKEGQFPEVSAVLRDRLDAGIKDSQLIVEGGPLPQLTALRSLSDTVAAGPFDEAYIEQIEEAIKLRIRRIVNPQTIADHLSAVSDAFDKINFLLDMCDVAVGDTAKRAIAGYILPTMSRPQIEAAFLGLNGNPMARMPEVVDLQKKVLLSELSEMYRSKISEKLDSYCRAALDNSNLLRKIDGLDVSVQEKALKLLDLLSKNYFTDGNARIKAENQALLYMRESDFTRGLNREAGNKKSVVTLSQFRKLLVNSGLIKRYERLQHRSVETTAPQLARL